MGKIALLGKFLFLDKLLFNLLKLPFPYIKLIINKNQKQWYYGKWANYKLNPQH